MNDIVVQATIDKGTIKTDAVIGRLVTIEVDTPVYTGDTNITVTNSDVTLQTKGKKIETNISIAQGIPEYSGATTFKVTDNNIIIATNGKRLNSDITVDISDVETLAEEISEVVG